MNLPPPDDTPEFIEFYAAKLRAWAVASGFIPVVKHVAGVGGEHVHLSWNDYDRFHEHLRKMIGLDTLYHKTLIILFSPIKEVEGCIVVRALPGTGRHSLPREYENLKWTSHLDSQIVHAQWDGVVRAAERATLRKLPEMMKACAQAKGIMGFSPKRLEEFALWNGVIYGAMAEFEELSSAANAPDTVEQVFERFAAALVESIRRSGDLSAVCTKVA